MTPKDGNRRRGRIGPTYCPEGGPRIEGFVIPCILMILNWKPAHGYELVDELNQLGFLKPVPDPGVVYRHLRALERDGMLTSHLEPGSGGPARKVYTLGDDGRRCYGQWLDSLKSRRECIDGLLSLAGEQRRNA